MTDPNAIYVIIEIANPVRAGFLIVLGMGLCILAIISVIALLSAKS